MGNVTGLVLYVVFAAIFFYVLYGVIRAGVRDGILSADKRRRVDTSASSETDPSAPR